MLIWRHHLHRHGVTHMSRRKWNHTWRRHALPESRRLRHVRHSMHPRRILSHLVLILLHHEHLVLELHECSLLVASLHFLLPFHHLLLLRQEVKQLLPRHAQYLIQLPKYEPLEILIRNAQNRWPVRFTRPLSIEDRLRGPRLDGRLELAACELLGLRVQDLGGAGADLVVL